MHKKQNEAKHNRISELEGTWSSSAQSPHYSQEDSKTRGKETSPKATQPVLQRPDQFAFLHLFVLCIKLRKTENLDFSSSTVTN